MRVCLECVYESCDMLKHRDNLVVGNEVDCSGAISSPVMFCVEQNLILADPSLPSSDAFGDITRDLT